jgi:hypothetical protein
MRFLILLLAFALPAMAAFTDAAEFGFSPDAGGRNTRALQKAVDRAGTIVVSLPGTYEIAATVYRK